MKIINDIIRLKEQIGLVEVDATYRNQVQWYYYLMSKDQLEYEYDKDGKLVGFLEWIRVPSVPTKLEDLYTRIGHRDFTKGKVAFGCNAISLNNSLHKLVARVLKKVKDAELVCFHRKKSGLIRAYKNIRRES